MINYVTTFSLIFFWSANVFGNESKNDSTIKWLVYFDLSIGEEITPRHNPYNDQLYLNAYSIGFHFTKNKNVSSYEKGLAISLFYKEPYSLIQLDYIHPFWELPNREDKWMKMGFIGTIGPHFKYNSKDGTKWLGGGKIAIRSHFGILGDYIFSEVIDAEGNFSTHFHWSMRLGLVSKKYSK